MARFFVLSCLHIVVASSLVTLAICSARPLLPSSPLRLSPVESPSSAPSGHGQQSGNGGSGDKSMTGVEVILGGFATAVLAIIFCYIRVTRRKEEEDHSHLAQGENKV